MQRASGVEVEKTAAGLVRLVRTNRGPHAPAPVTGIAPHWGNRARPRTAAADPVAARYDEPTVRHVRRGTTIAALAALGAMGATALVDALHEDRYPKMATLSNLSLLKTWKHFHDEAFGHERPPLPLLPITVRILVMIGALFKAGGYRSYPNYVSSIRSKHIEAGRE